MHDAFAEKFAARIKALKVGPGTQAGVNQGPLIDAAAVAKIEDHRRRTRPARARSSPAASGTRSARTFFEPTLLPCACPQMKIFREETFGPVAPLVAFASDEEAIGSRIVPSSGSLRTSTRDVGRAWRVAEALEYGMVGINTGLITTEVAPFGGVKQSGIGREGSKYGIDECVETKYVCFAGL